jgi:hypothetical protein
MTHHFVRRHGAAVFLIAAAIAAGCRARPAPGKLSAGPPRLASVNELSDAEKQYGHSAAPSAGVTYQPDVVLLPAGAGAIRGRSADSLVWTIDPGAEGAANIQPGTVLLLTSRAAGRVLAVQRESDGLHVVLGPVAITEIIRDGQFALDQPVDLTQSLSFAAPEVFDPAISVAPVVARANWPDGDGMFVRPVAFAPAGPVTVHRFTLTPFVDTKGVGVRIVSTAGGVMFLGQAVLYLNAPQVHFVLDIKGGRLVSAEVELSGVAGLLMEFEAAMPKPTDANINERRFAAHDFVVPIAGVGGVPLAVNVRQQFLLRTVFTSTGSLKARGYYTLKGGIRAGYRDGKFSVSGPTGFDARETLLPSIQGAAIGVTGMVMTHHLNVIVGVGGWGFVTGPYSFLNSSVTATRGSSIGMVVCRQESVSMGVGAGVGYQMPEPVTSAINAILRTLHISEQIKSSGGVQTNPVVLVSKGWKYPALQICG